MASRLDFQTKLESILGSRNVYFQPPESIKLNYPCIIYKLNNVDVKNADDSSYIINKSYQVTLIHRDPDNETMNDILLGFKHVKLNNYFTSENLHHYVYTIFF